MPVFVASPTEVYRGEEAEARLRETNDVPFYEPDSGVVWVDEARWQLAQDYERTTWIDLNNNAGDDRNMEHADGFDGYHALPKNLGNYIELGCGAFTNSRFILQERRTKSITLLDPLAADYFESMTNCSYKGGKLLNRKVNIVARTIEDFSVQQEYDAVVMINTLHHCRDADNVLSKILTMLKHRGWLVWAEEPRDYDVAAHYDVGHPIAPTSAYIEAFLSLFNPVYRNSFYFIGRLKSKLDKKARWHKQRIKVASKNLVEVLDNEPRVEIGGREWDALPPRTLARAGIAMGTTGTMGVDWTAPSVESVYNREIWHRGSMSRTVIHTNARPPERYSIPMSMRDASWTVQDDVVMPPDIDIPYDGTPTPAAQEQKWYGQAYREYASRGGWTRYATVHLSDDGGIVEEPPLTPYGEQLARDVDAEMSVYTTGETRQKWIPNEDLLVEEANIRFPVTVDPVMDDVRPVAAKIAKRLNAWLEGMGIPTVTEESGNESVSSSDEMVYNDGDGQSDKEHKDG